MSASEEVTLNGAFGDVLNTFNPCQRAMFCGQFEPGLLHDDISICNTVIKNLFNTTGGNEDIGADRADINSISDAKCVNWKLDEDYISVSHDCDPNNTNGPSSAPTQAPTQAPTDIPTQAPSVRPTAPILQQTEIPTDSKLGTGTIAAVSAAMCVIAATIFYHLNRRKPNLKMSKVVAEDPQELTEKGEKDTKISRELKTKLSSTHALKGMDAFTLTDRAEGGFLENAIKNLKKDMSMQRLMIDSANIQFVYNTVTNQREILGKGSFGSVFLGVYLGAEVAIKEMNMDTLEEDEDSLSRFLEELRLTSSLRHPSIIQVLGATFGSEIGLVCEIAKNGSLQSFLKKNRGERVVDWLPVTTGRAEMLLKLRSEIRASSREGDDDYSSSGTETRQIVNMLNLSSGMHNTSKLKWALEVANGLLYLHSQPVPILHRDLKSANILLDHGMHVKITDFGESREDEKRSAEEIMTTVGTPFFMAPELFAAKPNYNTSVDVYAFAILLLEMHVDGSIHDVFENMGPMVVIKKICMDGWRPDLSKILQGCEVLELKDLIESCWAQEPADRPEMATIVELLSAMKQKYC